MSSQKDHEFKKNLERCYKIVQQSSAKGGINAVEVAEKLGKHRTTAHGYLNTLEYMGKIESQHGTWHAKIGEQTTKPLLEKEIVIELPMPRDKWADVARLKVHADYAEEMGLSSVAKMERTVLEQFDETRTIRIRGKNVDDIDLEKIGTLIQQANERSSKFNFRGLFKGLKKSLPNSTASNIEKPADTNQNKSSET